MKPIWKTIELSIHDINDNNLYATGVMQWMCQVWYLHLCIGLGYGNIFKHPIRNLTLSHMAWDQIYHLHSSYCHSFRVQCDGFIQYVFQFAQSQLEFTNFDKWIWFSNLDTSDMICVFHRLNLSYICIISLSYIKP